MTISTIIVFVGSWRLYTGKLEVVHEQFGGCTVVHEQVVGYLIPYNLQPACVRNLYSNCWRLSDQMRALPRWSLWMATQESVRNICRYRTAGAAKKIYKHIHEFRSFNGNKRERNDFGEQNKEGIKQLHWYIANNKRFFPENPTIAVLIYFWSNHQSQWQCRRIWCKWAHCW